jgi:methionyl-tRNA formyltransferase
MKEKNTKFIFFGTPEIASQTLENLIINQYIPSLIITNPDKPSGRGMKLTKSPTKVIAEKYKIPYLQPEKIDSNFINEISALNFQLSIVIAYGKILPLELINLSPLGTINVHYSLLPKYRGASPIESALLNGDKITGISIQQMVYKLDSGPIINKKEITINESETKESLKNKLITIGSNLLCDTLPHIFNREISPIEQNENEASYCKKISKEQGEIDFNDDPKINFNKYRAFYDWPGTFFYQFKNNKKIRLKINEAVLENNNFIIKKVTPEGKKMIPYSLFMQEN